MATCASLGLSLFLCLPFCLSLSVCRSVGRSVYLSFVLATHSPICKLLLVHLLFRLWLCGDLVRNSVAHAFIFLVYLLHSFHCTEPLYCKDVPG